MKKAALERRIREARRLRPLLPEVVGLSNLIDKHRGPIIRRLLRITRDPRRSAKLAAQRGIVLWGDTPDRFQALFVDHAARATWLLDESAKRVAWLGGCEADWEASLLIRVTKANPTASTLTRLRRLQSMAIKQPQRRGRPRGRRDSQPRLVPGFTIPEYRDLVRQVRRLRETLGRKRLALFSRERGPAQRGLLKGRAHDLLEAIAAKPTAPRILRRLELSF